MLEILQRVEEPESDNEWEDLDSDDEVNDKGLAERLDGVNLNNADAVWERLTDEEKQEFKSIIHNGEIEKIVKTVEPWWKQKLEVKLVRDVQEDEAKLKEIIKNCPKIKADIKDFNKISSKPPAPCIVYNIANIIGAYTYIFRYYNGDHLSFAPEATDNLISICENLKSNSNFESISSVTDSIMLNCHNVNLFFDLNNKGMILEDLKDIFDGPGDDKYSSFYILSALSDILRLFKTAKLMQKQKDLKDLFAQTAEGSKKFSSEFISVDDKMEFINLQNQNLFVGCLRKLEFFLSFVKFRYNRNEWPVSWSVL